jgi:hypothetical protein
MTWQSAIARAKKQNAQGTSHFFASSLRTHSASLRPRCPVHSANHQPAVCPAMSSRTAVVDSSSLPFLSSPHDNLRQGLPALKADAQLVHPVAAIQQGVRARANVRAARGRCARVDDHLTGHHAPPHAGLSRAVHARDAGQCVRHRFSRAPSHRAPDPKPARAQALLCCQPLTRRPTECSACLAAGFPRRGWGWRCCLASWTTSALSLT